MGWFGFGEKKVVDLSERYKKEQAKAAEAVSEAGSSVSEGVGSMFGFMSGKESSESSSEESIPMDVVSSSDEKKKRLAKRLTDITEKLEDLSNQIYHLQQRIELLERKAGV